MFRSGRPRSMIPSMFESLARIEAALATVQKTIDALSSRGDDEAAFELARQQFTTSIRDSWPANLGKLVGALERVASDDALHLQPDERAQLREAIEIFRAVRDQ